MRGPRPDGITVIGHPGTSHGTGRRTSSTPVTSNAGPWPPTPAQPPKFRGNPAPPDPLTILVGLAATVGCVGGIYGIGGGSILAPILIGSGRRPADVAPAALASTFVTSVAGVITFTILAAHQLGPVAPDWPTGIALGLGGLAGGYTGARLQSRLPGALIRRLIGALVIAIGARYLWSGLA